MSTPDGSQLIAQRQQTIRVLLNIRDGKIVNCEGVVAYYGDDIAGICALVKLQDLPYDYELSKMAVDPEFQGLGIGYELAKAIEDRAVFLGGKTLYIESNTILGPAMKLYRKLGFKEIKGDWSPYERCNIYFLKDIG